MTALQTTLFNDQPAPVMEKKTNKRSIVLVQKPSEQSELSEKFTPAPAAKPKRKYTKKIEPTGITKIKNIYNILISKEFALILFILVQIGQTFHTTFVLHFLTGMNSIVSWIFSVMVAIGIDLIIVHLVGRGNTKAAYAFGFYYFSINYFAFMANPVVYFDFETSYFAAHNMYAVFALIPSAFIPYSAHQLSIEMAK